MCLLRSAKESQPALLFGTYHEILEENYSNLTDVFFGNFFPPALFHAYILLKLRSKIISSILAYPLLKLKLTLRFEEILPVRDFSHLGVLHLYIGKKKIG